MQRNKCKNNLCSYFFAVFIVGGKYNEKYGKNIILNKIIAKIIFAIILLNIKKMCVTLVAERQVQHE